MPRIGKRVVCCLSVVVTVLRLCCACTEVGTASVRDERENCIILSHTEELTGDWGNGWWTSGAADAEICMLMNDLGIMTVNRSGEYVINPTVVESVKTEKDDLACTYTIRIREGLFYNDASPITARDYLAYLLLACSPVLREIGVTWMPENPIGAADYASGASPVLSGARLLDEYTLSLTVSFDCTIPFDDCGLLNPLPVKMWLPEGFYVADDGEGAYFAGGDIRSSECKESIRHARTLCGDRICSGPYQLESFDTSDLQAVLTINPFYPGNFEGQKPSIGKVIYRKTEESTRFDQLASGEIDVICGLSGACDIAKAMEMQSGGGYGTRLYDRAGYGYIDFACDFGPTRFCEVRYALAYLLDREEFAAAYTGGFGSVVNAPYSPALWMYREGKEELEKRLNPYRFSVESAISELEAAGFVLDAYGESYTDGIRYKLVTEEEARDDGHCVILPDGRILMPLILDWCCSEDNPVTALLAERFEHSEAMKKAGMKIRPHCMPFGELVKYLCRDGTADTAYAKRTYMMFNLASEFTPGLELPGFGGQTVWTANGMPGEGAADDREQYLSDWLNSMEARNEELPELPLYTDECCDVFSDRVVNYEVNAWWSVIRQLPYLRIRDSAQ